MHGSGGKAQIYRLRRETLTVEACTARSDEHVVEVQKKALWTWYQTWEGEIMLNQTLLKRQPSRFYMYGKFFRELTLQSKKQGLEIVDGLIFVNNVDRKIISINLS